MMSFLALHHIAAQRGDGLRPELVELLERSRAITDADPASPYPSGTRRLANEGTRRRTVWLTPGIATVP
jgi:hypothetical protein